MATKYCFKKIGFASDHAGKELKSSLLEFLKPFNFELVDFGVDPDSTLSVDYPDYSARLAQELSEKKLDAGIAVCGTGIGMSIVANKFSNVRAVCVWDEFSTRMSRAHNDANLMCLGGRVLTFHRAKDLVELWLKTPFMGEQHSKRLEKIKKLEEQLKITRA